MILLFSSAGQEIYKQFILQVLCYPSGYLLSDVPFRLELVEDRFVHRPVDLDRKDAAVVFVDYVERDGMVKPVFFPLRRARIEHVTKFAGKLLLRIRLAEYVHYDDNVRRAYAEEIALPPQRLWNQVISQHSNAPTVVARDLARPIDANDPSSWRSGGKFIIEMQEDLLDLGLPAADAVDVREQCEDWKSTIDMVADRKQLRDKLFYQIWDVRRAAGEAVALTDSGGRSLYELLPGENVDLVLHFYFGARRQIGDKRVLEVLTETGYLGMLGTTAIDVYPEQISGKIERVRLIVKKQLSEEFTRITLQEKVMGAPALARADLYVRIRPRTGYVGAILIAFFLGSLLNAFTLPTGVAWTWLTDWAWVPKVAGSALMSYAFWLAFSKFPSKS